MIVVTGPSVECKTGNSPAVGREQNGENYQNEYIGGNITKENLGTLFECTYMFYLECILNGIKRGQEILPTIPGEIDKYISIVRSNSELVRSNPEQESNLGQDRVDEIEAAFKNVKDGEYREALYKLWHKENSLKNQGCYSDRITFAAELWADLLEIQHKINNNNFTITIKSLQTPRKCFSILFAMDLGGSQNVPVANGVCNYDHVTGEVFQIWDQYNPDKDEFELMNPDLSLETLMGYIANRLQIELGVNITKMGDGELKAEIPHSMLEKVAAMIEEYFGQAHTFGGYSAPNQLQ